MTDKWLALGMNLATTLESLALLGFCLTLLFLCALCGWFWLS